jgi:hypothetical protein
MIEDLYTGRTTIRQVRQSHSPNFPMKQVWEMVKRIGGAGIKEENNYMLCPSDTFCNAIANISPEMQQYIIVGWSEYYRKYPITMLIQD